MLRVAVDFDGTIVENRYPAIGKPQLFAFETLRALQGNGILLILWTVRNGKLLNEAVEFCRSNGIEFYAINKNHPDEPEDLKAPRKLDVDIYIDDRNVGGFIGWGEVWSCILPEKLTNKEGNRFMKGIRGKGFMSFFKR